MAKKIFLTTFIILGMVFYVNSAQAHELQTDGSIGVVMHIDPDDDPIVGKPSTLSFEVTDSSKHFSPANCDCNLEIESGGKQLVNSLLQPDASNQSIFSFSLPFTFAQKGSFDVTFSGHPKVSGAFSDFKVLYQVPVSRTNSLPTLASFVHLFHPAHLFDLFLIIFGFIIAYIWQWIEDRNRKSKAIAR